VSHPDRCLHELIEEQVERTPEAVAVVFDGNQLTYRQLNERANQVAHHLQKLGVRPDTLVGICVDRSLEIVVGLLGILKAGGAYVPLDPEYPKDRLAFMLEDAAVQVLLTQQHLTASLPTHQTRIVRLDADWARIAEKGLGNVTSPVTAEHLAYMIYTSGSTGRPKGATIPHRAIVNRLLWMQDAYRLTPSDRVLQKTPFSFDVSVWEFFWPLLTGAKLVVALPGGHKDGAYLANLIREEKVTTIHFVPSMLSAFLEQGGLETSCASLKRVICSGEALPFELQQRFFSLLPAELHNLYGPTETTVDVTYWACERDSRLRTVPIGRPIANTQIYILDRHLQPTPIGVPGELHIGGIGLARGYHNRPELTAEKFIPDPFRSEPGARLYKTGDLARYLANGAIEYMGRMDHQVKIRGFRIELGEIEFVLAELPGVREAVVLAREDAPGDKRLVAYLTFKDGQSPNPSELRGLLQAKLPEYMVPSAFVTLEGFPLTPNGKVDRKALPAPEEKNIEIEQSYVAPTTYSEQVLCRIWRKWLKLERVGTQDNFFDLGGYSLLAVRVIGEINKILKAHLNVPTFFENPTIERLARILEQEHRFRPEPHEPQLVPLQPGHTGLPLFIIGSGLPEYRIAQLIGKDRAIFAIDVPMPTEWSRAIAAGDRGAMPSIEQLGALYGDALSAYAGSSPCVVVGCNSGMIAFEAAHVLQRSGGNIAFVLLIDAFTWSGHIRGTAWLSLLWMWRDATGTADDTPYAARLSALLGNSWRLLRWLLARIPSAVKRRLVRATSPSFKPSRMFDEEGVPFTHAALNRFLRIAAKSFHPTPLDASGVLIRAEFPGDEMLPGFDFSNGWDGLFAWGLEIVQARGDHTSMVDDENAAALGRQINEVLDRDGLNPTCLSQSASDRSHYQQDKSAAGKLSGPVGASP
jgi:amino acid adenylation domain-containing protein